MTTAKLVMIGVKLPPDLIERVREMARADGRSVSGLVRRIIAREVAARGATGDLR